MRILVAAFVSLALLSGCGASPTEPVSDATPAAPAVAEDTVVENIDAMVVPRLYMTRMPRSLRVTTNSGWEDNRAAAAGSLDPNDSAELLAGAGRITGYQLSYYDPTREALRSGSGVTDAMTWVEVFSNAKAAAAYLQDRIAYARSLAGTSPREGISFDAVTSFDVRMSADEAYGLRESADYGGDRVFRSLVSFRRGRIVAGTMVVRADDGDDGSEAAKALAGTLDGRVKAGLGGGASNGEPVLIPADGVPLDGEQPTAERPPGAPDLAALVLQPGDVPPGIRCAPGRYTHTTPPRITFRRAYCPLGKAVGGTSLTALTSEVSAFESELLAQTSLSLTVQSLLSPEGIEGFAANFAASTGLVPTNIRTRRLELEGGGVGLLTTFDTSGGGGVDFYALAQHGRGLTTLDAIGPAEGFDHRDLLPLLQTVERRLDRLR